jgi:hypothetical protein
VSDEHRIAIVVCDEFVGRLADLASTQHVWIARTPAAAAVAQHLWAEAAPADGDGLGSGVTLFDGGPTPTDSVLSIVDTVELHHGSYSNDPRVTIIDMLGAQATDKVCDAFTDGFLRIDETADGFVARRLGA